MEEERIERERVYSITLYMKTGAKKIRDACLEKHINVCVRVSKTR